MSHRGKRSAEGTRKQTVRRVMLDTSLRDRELAETICRIHAIEEDTVIGDPGDVLIDARGRGALQQLPPAEVNRLT